MKPTGAKFRAEEMVREFRTEYKSDGEPAYRAPWYRAVNWDAAAWWFCAGGLAVVLISLGIFVFGPFGIKLVFGE